MLETIMLMFKLTWRNWHRMLRFTRHYKDIIQEIHDFEVISFLIYWSTCVPEIIKIEKGMVYLSKPKIFSDPFW